MLAKPATAFTTPVGAPPAPDAASQPASALVAESKALRQRSERLKRDIETLTWASSPERVKEVLARKQMELEEVRQGLFCSGCGLTRSQILAKGETFPHPEQHIVRATPAQIEAKERELEQAVEAAVANRVRAEERLHELERERTKVTSDGELLAMRWRMAMLAEDEARAKAWQGVVERYKSEVGQTQEMIDSTRRRIDEAIRTGADKKSIELDVYKHKLSLGHMENIRERATKDVAAYRDQLTNFDRAMAEGRAELGQMLNETGGRMLIPPSLPTFSATIPGTAFGAKATEDSIALSHGLNFGDIGSKSLKLRAALRASGDWLRGTLQVSAAFEATLPLLGTVRAGMQQVKHPDGTITSEPLYQVDDAKSPSVTDLMTAPQPPAPKP